MSGVDRWPHGIDGGVRDRLLAAYADPRRGYHDTRHLAEVLDHVASLGGDEVTVLAAWFHDAVYDPTRADNEVASAQLAHVELAGTGDEDEVARLVRLTATHRPGPDDTRGQILCDADLAILAADDERYAAYVAGVRREYAHVTDEEFDIGRSRILADLLAKPSLFHTAYGRANWEGRARENVRAELAQRPG